MTQSATKTGQKAEAHSAMSGPRLPYVQSYPGECEMKTPAYRSPEMIYLQPFRKATGSIRTVKPQDGGHQGLAGADDGQNTLERVQTKQERCVG